MIAFESYTRGYRYLLTVTDTLSTKAWAEAVKYKTALSVTEGMKNSFNKSKQKLTTFQTDAGKKFVNTHFSQLMQSYQINHYSTYCYENGNGVLKIINKSSKNNNNGLVYLVNE